MMPFAGSRDESFPALVASVYLISTSLQCDSPLSSAYRLWIFMRLLSCLRLQERRVGRQAEEELADRLEVGLAALDLLGDRVDIPEAPVEGAAREDGGPAGDVMHGVHDLLALMDGIRRGKPDAHPLLHRDRAGSADGVPDLIERGVEQEPRGGELRL